VHHDNSFTAHLIDNNDSDRQNHRRKVRGHVARETTEFTPVPDPDEYHYELAFGDSTFVVI
jgi:hypothetical protein